jgi:hypothetical protein
MRCRVANLGIWWAVFSKLAEPQSEVLHVSISINMPALVVACMMQYDPLERSIIGH